MKLSDLLVDAWVAAPLEAADLGGALHELFTRVAARGHLSDRQAAKAARDLAFGSQGEVVRIDPRAVAVVDCVEGLTQPALGIGVAEAPFQVTAEGRSEPGRARIVVLILAAGKLSGARQDLVPAVVRALKVPGVIERLETARSSDDVRAIQELMETSVDAKLVVEDALVPVKYRVYPDTPLDEVVDLMVRRGVHAVPVVGERYEVLGILTAGDALEHILQEGRRGDEDKPRIQDPLARDFMTRSVLCVSEDQALVEAANMMVNRDVEQLPVVREGEFVGFVTRDSILRALTGALEPENSPEDENGTQS